ncbi:uncharacterized protein LOC114302838 [Camellia sinensis]|uniref:uncharacterized protein LOC114302838 n=1 Tax=Camellia sinensis TaxID=4442 RepID=UPI001036D281|nr:uncharacterized protein LOC114302838 [Camellia sinensis]
MSVAEYEAKFTELARLAPHMVDIDYKKARKFEGGLDLDVFHRVGVLKLPIYVEVLDRALMAEAILATKKQAPALTTKWKGKRSGFNFKKGRSFPKGQNTGSSSSSSQNSGSIPNYPDCGRKNKGTCYCASSACFRCGKTNHMVRDCPLRSNDVNYPIASLAESTSVAKTNARANTRGNIGNEILRQGRVFALVLGDVQNTKSVVSVHLPYLISAMKANKLLRKGCRGYLCCVLVMNANNANVENIPVVNEFPDVFLTDLPRDLIDKEIEFTIDVVPGT